MIPSQLYSSSLIGKYRDFDNRKIKDEHLQDKGKLLTFTPIHASRYMEQVESICDK